MISRKLHSRSIKKGRMAFTLIELLVVIAIIALLVSILLPSLTKAKELAKTAVCLSQQKQIGLAFALYAEENEGVMPPFAGYYPGQLNPYWFELIGDYVGKDGSTHPVGLDYMRCPTAEPPNYGSGEGVYTYGVNYGQVFRYLSISGISFTPRRLSQLSPSTFLLGDAESPAIYTPNMWTLSYDPVDDGFSTSSNMVSPYYNHFSPRHGKKEGVFIFADGSARTESLRNWANNENRMWGGTDY